MKTLSNLVSAASPSEKRAVLGLRAAIFDWIRLGVFTGSRVSEYAQTKARRGTFLCVPQTPVAGIWAGTPIAFLPCDFTHHDKQNQILSFAEVVRKPGLVTDLHVRFRFDKSLQNFTIRKFKRTGHEFLCPILASISILCRAAALRVSSSAPLGAFRPQANISTFTYLTSTDVIRTGIGRPDMVLGDRILRTARTR
jgi:hypothetical protein